MVVASSPTNPLARDLDHVVATMGPLWETLRGARLFITGGTGFVGCWLLETLLWANDRLSLDTSTVVLTRNAAAFYGKVPHLARHSAVTLIEGDVRTFDFPEGPFSHVVHAATTSSAVVPPGEMFDTIVSGTRRTLECARLSGASRLLLVSSGAVYGMQPAGVERISEDFHGGPVSTVAANAYAEGKRAAEMLCALQAGAALEPVIARCFAFVGPYLPLDAHFAAGNFIRDALRGGPIRVTGNGAAQRSYLYAADLAVWLWTILLRGASMRPYNVGSSAGLSIETLARLTSQLVTPASPVQVASRATEVAALNRYVPSVERAEVELGLRSTVPLDHGLKRTFDWHRR